MISGSRFFRMVTGMAMGILLLLGTAAAAAAAEYEEFTGYFTERKYIRISPEANTSVVAWVPPDTPLVMLPVSDSYAETTYNDISGYIHYVGVIRLESSDSSPAATTPPVAESAPAGDRDVVAYVAYSEEAQPAFAQPDVLSEVRTVYPSYTPFTVVATNGAYAKIHTESGETSYVRASGLRELEKDETVDAYEAYIGEAKILYEKPLAGASVLAILPPSTQLTVTAENGNYVRVLAGSQSGYLPGDDIIRKEVDRGNASYARVPAAAILYTAPDAQSYSEEYLPGNTIVEIDAETNGYARIKSSGLFLREGGMERIDGIQSTQARYGYWPEDQMLYATIDAPLLPTGTTIPASTLVEVNKGLRGYYLVQIEGMIGFVEQAGFEAISISQAITPIAAYVTYDIQLLSQPFSFSAPIGKTLVDNTHLWLQEESGDFYRVEVEGEKGYISKAAVVVLGEDVAASGYEVYVGSDTQLLNFPSEQHGGQVAKIPGNTLVKVMSTNGDFYYVQNILGSGYLPRREAKTFEQAMAAVTPAGAQRYYLFLNKSTRELTIYYADAQGRRTELIHKTLTIAIGRRTTPTPSGVFTLGEKERWHYFGPSYAPYAIAFTLGRYLHGPLYYSDAETSLNLERIDDFGEMATGGCLRIPYDDMMWIFFNCMGDTTLEIVNGVAQ